MRHGLRLCRGPWLWRQLWRHLPQPSSLRCLHPSPATIHRRLVTSSAEHPQPAAPSNGASTPAKPGSVSSSSASSTDLADASPSSPPLTVAQRCDPYEQQGQPLSTERVQQLLPTLDSGWAYEPSTRTLTKAFSFRPPPTPSFLHPPHTSPSPSSPRPPPLSALFSFLSRIGQVCLNDPHPPYHLSIHPLRLSVTVDLRTPPLHGLSYKDLALAIQLDGLHRTLTHRSLT